MNLNKYHLTMVFAVLALVGVFLVPFTTYAQGADVIQAEVDRTHLSTDDSLVLTITINAAEGTPSQPVLPPLAGFQITGQSSGQSIQIINGAMTTQMTYQFRLQPNQAGDFMIDPISTTVNGQSYNTAPIVIKVSQGSGQTGTTSGLNRQVSPAEAPTELTGQDFFVEAEVDNPTPYQGQQILHTFRFYQAVNIVGRTEYSQPPFSGFWHDQQAEQSEYYAESSGRTYLVTELVTPLFPTLAGELIIEPASITIPGGFFSRGRTLATQPVTVDVQPLPAGAPAQFGGAVGQFTIQSETANTNVMVGDTVNLQVTLRGRGNVDATADPKLPVTSQWRLFDSEPTTETWYEDGALVGTRTYEWVLVPTEAGQLTIPAIQYSYFDPDTSTYETISTDPILVNVSVDPHASNAAVQPIPTGTDSDPMAVTSPGADMPNMTLQPLKHTSEPLAAARNPLPLRAGYWLLWLIPVALIAGQFAWQNRQNHRRSNAPAIRSKQAASKARHLLAQAQRNGQDPAAAAAILQTYLTEKLNRAVSGLTQAELAVLLRGAGVGEDLVGRVQQTLLLSENRRYAPADYGPDTNDLLTETGKLIADLEQALA